MANSSIIDFLLLRKSLCAWTANVSFATFLLLALSLNNVALSQTVDVSNDAEVSELLAEIESQNKTRSVFNIDGGQKIADVEFDSVFNIIESVGQWRIVEFNQRTVPGWVSTDYVNVSKGRVEVDTDNLNMRLKPFLNSPILLQLNRGYSSKLMSRRNGFVRLLAPAKHRVAIFSGSDSDAKQNIALLGSGSLIRNTSQRIDKPQVSIAEQPSDSKNRPLPELLLGEPIPTSSERLHVIAPGDAVSLLVFGETDLSIQNVRVPQSGRVSFPLIGSVVVAGRTIPQVEESVAELLAQGYVKNPRLSVTMFSYRPVFIRGAVRQIGSFPFTEGLTVGKIIALAGGSKKSAKSNGVSILREGNVIEEALSINSQIEVQSGDVISIEEEIGVQEDDASYIYLHGEVASPGEYQFRRGLTVEKAIVLAGGFTLRGSRKKISVTRYADAGADGEPEKLKKTKLYTPIKPGDVINVGATWF